MTYHFNVSGEDRRNLVKAISSRLGIEAKYLGVPSCGYQIGSYTVSKDGALSWNDLDDADPAHLDESTGLVQALEEAGFHSDEAEFFAEQQEAIDAKEAEEADAEETEDEPVSLTIELPLDSAAVPNLRKILEAKGNLIKESLGIDSLPVEERDGTVAFPWFTELPDADHIDAYTKLIAAICRLAKEAKRVTAKEKDVENRKYAFRCFLLRLGFIGEDSKRTRKLLMENFTGSSAFRNGPKGGEE